MSDSSTYVVPPLQDDLQDLLCDLVYGWEPSSFPLSPARQLVFGDVDLSHLPAEVRIDQGRLQVTVTVPIFDEARGTIGQLGAEGSLRGMLADGTHFEGTLASTTRRAITGSQDQELCSTVTIQAVLWSFGRGISPHFWIGFIEGNISLGMSGNLAIERHRSNMPLGGATCHLLLSGAYIYCVVKQETKTGTRWYMTIDTRGAGEPDRQLLGRDFQALQFVLGSQLRMPTLVGVSGERVTIACTKGFDSRSQLEPHTFPPVPVVRNNDAWIDECWTGVLFERISATWQEQPTLLEALSLAFEMYLDSMRYNLDSDYMRLQIAIEAFAYWCLKQESTSARLDVKDKNAWKSWVKQNREAIRSLAAKGRENALYDKVMTVYRLASGKVVPAAFGDLPLTEEMSAELKGRDVVVHQGLMAPEGYDVERDLRRIRLVRTMLVALIARKVGYGGAINGWERGHMGYPLEPQEWWTIDEAFRLRATRRFLIEQIVETTIT